MYSGVAGTVRNFLSYLKSLWLIADAKQSTGSIAQNQLVMNPATKRLKDPGKWSRYGIFDGNYKGHRFTR